MNAIPWHELVIGLPLLGFFWIRANASRDARSVCLAFAGITLALACGLYLGGLQSPAGSFEGWFGWNLIHIDQFSAPLIPLTALIYFVTLLATVGHKTQQFPFAGALISESLTLGTLSTDTTWWMILLVSLSVVPMWFELKARGCSTRVYEIHQAIFVGCLILGGCLSERISTPALNLSVVLLTLAVLVRSGAFPFHLWRIDMFEKASFGSSILMVSPMLGAYLCMRLVLPTEPDWALHAISFLSLATSVYASGMALVQNDGRRFFCYLFLSHSSLVLVGLELATPIGLTAALCMWLSVGLALTSYGITLRCIEARVGRIDLNRYYGLYSHMPTMAAFFLLTGLASVGFPCTIGFIAGELLIESAMNFSPWIGWIVVLATALNGIAVMRAYFRIFTGTKHPTTIPMRSQFEERFAIVGLSLLIIAGGLYPQPEVESSYKAALHLLEDYHRAGDHGSKKDGSNKDGSVIGPAAEASPDRRVH